MAFAVVDVAGSFTAFVIVIVTLRRILQQISTQTIIQAELCERLRGGDYAPPTPDARPASRGTPERV